MATAKAFPDSAHEDTEPTIQPFDTTSDIKTTFSEEDGETTFDEEERKTTIGDQNEKTTFNGRKENNSEAIHTDKDRDENKDTTKVGTKVRETLQTDSSSSVEQIKDSLEDHKEDNDPHSGKDDQDDQTTLDDEPIGDRQMAKIDDNVDAIYEGDLVICILSITNLMYIRVYIHQISIDNF